MAKEGLQKPISVALYGSDFCNDALNLEVLFRHGTIESEDLNLFSIADVVDDAFDSIVKELG